MKPRGMFEKQPGSGIWWIRYVDAQGRYRREKAGTKTAATALYHKRKQEVLEGRKLPEKLRRALVSFREIAQDALEYSRAHKRSYRNDRCRMTKLLEWLGDSPAEAVLAQDIEKHFEQERWAPATANRYRALLSLTYRLAIRNGKVRENPARLVRQRPENNTRVRFLSREEEKRLHESIQQEFSEHLAEFDLALNTGLRLSEQYEARWENVDFEHRVLTVPRSKNGQPRHVRLNDAAVGALLRLRDRTEASAFTCGGIRTPRVWFERVLELAEISGFSWHCLRHTFASRLVTSGADLRTVAELLGDKTLAMVMRYAHLAPDYQLAAVKRMESQFGTDTRIAPEPLPAPTVVN